MIDVVRMLAALKIEPSFKRGDELWAPCPLPGHDEKTPSWSINEGHGPKRGFHKCFGCDEKGGPVALVKSIHGFRTSHIARDWMKSRGLFVDDPTLVQVFVEVTKPDRFFLMPLSVKGKGVFDIWPKPFKQFAKQRGITAGQVQRWGIGYSVDGELANRIVIPVFDQDGGLKSYNARAIFKARSKYLTAKREDGADAGGVFGSLRWPSDDAERKLVFVTEGALNALAIERVFPRAHIAALDGSAMLPDHALAISSFDHICIVSDPDGAGDELAKKIRPAARWRKVSRANLPVHEDANDIELRDPRLLRRILRRAVQTHRNQDRRSTRRRGSRSADR